MARRILLILVASLAGVVLFVSPVSAHNSLASSDPADGSTVASAPTQLTLVFAKSVPLDTLSIEVIDASGVRSDLTGSVHGPNGDTEVLTPLPPLPAGGVTLRWRLVGSDGHAVTGRVAFTIAAPPSTTVPQPATTVGTVAPPGADTTTSTPSAAIPSTTITTTVTTVAVPAGSTGGGFSEPWTTSDSTRWLLRYSAYLAIMTIGGVIAVAAFVWAPAWNHPLIQRAVRSALAVTLATAVAQVLVIASDIRGTPPWSAWSGVGAALETDAGVAFVIRVALVAVLTWLMFLARIEVDESRWSLSFLVLLGLLATWAFAGHSRSMRWSLIGVPIDVAHQAAAAAWIGGLAIIGLIAIREAGPDELKDIVSRFGRLAATAVTVIVVTGVVQSIRLVGSPTQLFAANHGRFLVLKVVVLGAMLKVADINRQRVARRFGSKAITPRRVVENLRRAMGTELAVGLLVIAVTAAMVVSPPAVAQESTAKASATVASTSTTVLTVVESSVAQAGAVSCVVSGTILQVGSSGADVICLQLALQDVGLTEAWVVGTFDAATNTAVKSFQAANGLDVDGVVGAITGTLLGVWPAS